MPEQAEQDGAAQQDSTNTTTGGENPASDNLIKLTQDQLTERLNRKGASAVSSLLKELGVEDVGVLKSSLESLQALKQEKMTAEERIQAQLSESAKQLEALKARAEAATAEALGSKLEIAAYRAMSGLERPFADPAAALRLIDFSGVVKEGAVDAQALAEAVTSAADKYPWALAQTKIKTPGGTDNPPATPTGGRTDEERRQTYFQGAGKRSSDFFAGGGLVIPE